MRTILTDAPDYYDVKVFYAKVSDQVSEKAYQDYIPELPLVLYDKIMRYRLTQDRKLQFLGKALLLAALRDFGYESNCLEDLKFTEFQRPYMDGDIDFNISHSGAVVVCAIARGIKVGIDIEKIIPLDVEDYLEVSMNKIQQDMIQDSSNPLHSFYTLWTLKESILKGDGRGLNIPLKSVVIDNQLSIGTFQENKWYLRKINIEEEYMSHIALSDNIQNLEVIRKF